MTINVQNSDARLQAVMGRDRSADGQFVFAVRSTRIYCKPSCPAKRPAERNMLFFRSPLEAERAGFRACRRCRPNEATRRDPQAGAVERVCQIIDGLLGGLAPENSGSEVSASKFSEPPGSRPAEARFKNDMGTPTGCGGDLRLKELATSVGLSQHQLQRAFRRVLGISPRQYADARRMNRMKAQIKGGSDVTTALYEAGFGSSSRLYERAAGQMGMTPGTYRRGGEGMKIGYTIVDSPMGRLMVAATERGISAVYLAKDDGPLEAALKKEYPRAEIVLDKNGMNKWVKAILEHLRGKEPHLDLPTDVQATAFQRRVWEELRKIPYGATRTYTQVARAIGKPAAIRAVARACATNPTSIVVPCHRVVREDGNLAGYRWGIERKHSLLAREKSFVEERND